MTTPTPDRRPFRVIEVVCSCEEETDPNAVQAVGGLLVCSKCRHEPLRYTLDGLDRLKFPPDERSEAEKKLAEVRAILLAASIHSDPMKHVYATDRALRVIAPEFCGGDDVERTSV